MKTKQSNKENKTPETGEVLGYVLSLEEIKKHTVQPNYFNESDCGGVFDGNQVISDADPGL